LFIAGFGSSAVFGTFVGSLADKYGRKRMSIVFGILYSISCITKAYNNFNVLLFGRILGGVATSLLFSVFEAWMVYEHNKHEFSAQWMSNTFSLSIFGNGLVAILSGIMASIVVTNTSLGYVAPFYLAIVFLVVAIIMVSTCWVENYGDSEINISQTFKNAILALKSDYRIPLLGCVQSLFEASMYVFVFEWTPVLEHASSESFKEDPGLYGLIFAAYMVSIMIGSSIFSMLCNSWQPEQIAKLVLLTSFVTILVPAFTTNANFLLLAFMVYEVCCGLYFPTIGTLRAKYIPEESRAAVMNFFRIPLNVLVVAVLQLANKFDHTGTEADKTSSYSYDTVVFLICAMWLLLAFILQHILSKPLLPSWRQKG